MITLFHRIMPLCLYLKDSMEVKEVYLDLQKVERKWKTTFIIEDERFDKPITLKIAYDDENINEMKDIKKSCEAMESNIESLLTQAEWKEDKARELIKEYEKEIKLRKEINEQLEKDTAENDKRIEKQNTELNVMKGIILQLKDKVSEIEKKIKKQPRVFHDKIFISWNEETMFGVYNIPDGDYLQILNIKIWEHNEYCENKDEIIVDKIHSQDWLTPQYRLYGWTELDTPTATVFYDLILIPL